MFTKLLTSMLLWNNVCCQIHNIYLCICFLFWNIVMHCFTINGPCQRWHWRHYDRRRRSQDGRRWRTSRLRTRTGAGTRNPPECRIYRNRLVSKMIGLKRTTTGTHSFLRTSPARGNRTTLCKWRHIAPAVDEVLLLHHFDQIGLWRFPRVRHPHLRLELGWIEASKIFWSPH